MDADKYTISVYSENIPGLLQRVTAIFTRRKINIESLTVSETEYHAISRYTIVVNVSDEMARKLIDQIRRIVEVRQAYGNREPAIISREVALMRVDHDNEQQKEAITAIAESHGAHIAHIAQDSLIVESVGHEKETDALLADLRVYTITEFIRSGRIAVTREGDESERKRLRHLEKSRGIKCITNDKNMEN